jgi:hypothetical protein
VSKGVKIYSKIIGSLTTIESLKLTVVRVICNHKHIFFQLTDGRTEDPETVCLDEDRTAELDVREAHLAQKIEGILKTHFIAIRQMETPSYSKIIVKLGNLQSGENSAFKSITRAEMLTHMINMSERFRHFALLQR